MARSITEKELERIVERLNALTFSPRDTYTRDETGKMKSNPGNFHLSYAYGGVSLFRIVNEAGGASNVFSRGHISKRDLAELLFAYIRGYELALEDQVFGEKKNN